ncbi:uncharacterized protein SAPINGB_P000718 [Magnusiomyces paraingens]|uniref:Uncharacterized protein n=1 Tax=Magnusiomyces paraingens TaxID=2606893 RepID=A0A5E8B970_9ASCO|nr:uncharacterized protein SAPINGB_P000718 [Saprochaete ingens]VVT45342.1 unnamed protein product [Saprochaete ingens]
MFRLSHLKPRYFGNHLFINQKLVQKSHLFSKRNVSSSATSSSPREQLKAADMIAPVSRVFLYAFLTYSTLHAIWWNLEFETKEAQYKKELDDLEKKIYEKVAQLDCQIKEAGSQTELSAGEKTHNNIHKKSWFW